MKIVVQEGHDILNTLEFADTTLLIGSEDNAAIHIPDMRVAPKHANLIPLPGGTWLLDPIDLGFQTILNGRTVHSRTELEHGDEILIADFLIKILFEAMPEAPVSRTAIMEDVAKIRQHPLPAGALIRVKKEPYTLKPEFLDQISEFAFSIRDCTDISKLMDLVLSTVRRLFNARMVWLGLRRQDYGRLEYVEGQMPEGTTTTDPPNLETYTYRCLEREQFICVPRTDDESLQSILAIPLVGTRGKVGVIYLDSKNNGEVYDFGSLDLLCMLGSIVTRHYEAIIMEQIRLQEAIAAGELSFIREVQSRLDPSVVPQWDQLQFAVFCRPGLDNSGDVFDVMQMANGLATFFIAHVTAPSTRMALALVELRTAFRTAAMHANPPHILLRQLNYFLADEKDPATASCAAFVMNPKSGTIEYACTGGIGALLVDSCGEPEALMNPQVPLLGTSKHFNYMSHTRKLEDGESLALYTIGCQSIQDSEGNPFGWQHLTDSICNAFGIPASDALDNFLGDLEDCLKLGRQPDDLTIMFVHREE